MARKKQEQLEFRYYEMPQGSYVLPLLGEHWRRVYGRGEIGRRAGKSFVFRQIPPAGEKEKCSTTRN